MNHTDTSVNNEEKQKLAKANIRLALLLGGLVLLSLFVTFFFWPSPTLPQ